MQRLIFAGVTVLLVSVLSVSVGEQTIQETVISDFSEGGTTESISLLNESHPLTNKLVGKRVWFHYG